MPPRGDGPRGDCFCTRCRPSEDHGPVRVAHSTRSAHLRADIQRLERRNPLSIHADPHLVECIRLTKSTIRADTSGLRGPHPASERVGASGSSSGAFHNGEGGPQEDEEDERAVRSASGNQRDAAGSGARAAPLCLRTHFAAEAEQSCQHRSGRHIGDEFRSKLLLMDFPGKADLARTRPTQPPVAVELTESEKATLGMLDDWTYLDGKVRDFKFYQRRSNAHAAEGTHFASLHLAQKLAKQRSGLDYKEYPMCPNSCVAFLGPHEGLRVCPECQMDAYLPDSDDPVQTFRALPITPWLQASFARVKYSKAMRYRSSRVATASTLLAEGAPGLHMFSDIHDGFESVNLSRPFDDSRDCLLAITTDGAQLVQHRKHSSAWLVLIQNLNLPPSLRFALRHHHPALIIPGPSQPKDIDSYLWPLCAELAHLSERGAWTWDSWKGEWFRLHADLAFVLADQKGSSKVSCHVGGNGTRGCRYCLIRAVFADNGGSSAYFPLAPLVTHLPRNQGRIAYDPLNLPLRTKASLAAAVDDFKNLTVSERATRVRATGIVELPVVAFTRLFASPFFYPIDSFHLLHLNVPSLIWKTWVDADGLQPGEFGLDADQRSQLGLFMTANVSAYPTIFGSRYPRDISKSANTFYRAVEWSSAFHHFIPPFLYDIGAPVEVQDMLATYIRAVDAALSRDGPTEGQIVDMRLGFAEFVSEWERLYGSTDATLSRMTISVHQLLHVADQFMAIGSLKATSQASCERYLGMLKAGVRNFKNLYQSLDKRFLHKAQMHIIGMNTGLGWGGKRSGTGTRKRKQPDGSALFRVPVANRHTPLTPVQASAEAALLQSLPGRLNRVRRFVKMPLAHGHARSTRGEKATHRSSARVVYRAGECPAYGEVIQFMEAHTTSGLFNLAMIRKFVVDEIRPTFAVGRWTDTLALIDATAIQEIVAILTLGHRGYAVKLKCWQTDAEALRRKDGRDEDQDEEEDGAWNSVDFDRIDESDDAMDQRYSEEEESSADGDDRRGHCGSRTGPEDFEDLSDSGDA